MMKIKLLMLVAVVLLFAACQDCSEPPEVLNADSVVPNDTVVQDSPACFEAFWLEYREAILNSRKDYLRGHTRFPLNVWGHLDQDPKYSIEEELFDGVFELYLSTNHEVNKDEIISTVDATKLPRYDASDSNHFVGDLYFEWIDDKWVLTVMYLDIQDSISGRIF